MSVFKKEFTVSGRDVTMHGIMRPSMLLQLMQEGFHAHNELLGVGEAETASRGILWMVTHHYVRIECMPAFGEELILEEWPGRMRHVMFPRYCRILDKSGNVLVNASSIWIPVDSKTRRFVTPSEAGISIPGEETGNEAPSPLGINSRETAHKTRFTVPYSYIDRNGHMNNTRYFDLAEDTVSVSADGRALTEMRCEYHRELQLGQEIELDWDSRDGEIYFCGRDEKLYFQLTMKYK